MGTVAGGYAWGEVDVGTEAGPSRMTGVGNVTQLTHCGRKWSRRRDVQGVRDFCAEIYRLEAGRNVGRLRCSGADIASVVGPGELRRSTVAAVLEWALAKAVSASSACWSWPGCSFRSASSAPRRRMHRSTTTRSWSRTSRRNRHLADRPTGFLRSDDTNRQIQGYASATSVNKGGSISFAVTVNPVQNFTADIYRMGWYRGLGARQMAHVGPIGGTNQRVCTPNSTTGSSTADGRRPSATPFRPAGPAGSTWCCSRTHRTTRAT